MNIKAYFADTVPVKTSKERRRKHPASSYADVQVELTRMVFTGLMPTIIIGGIGMVGATASLAWHYDDRLLMWLSLAMTVLCVARGVYTHLFLKRTAAALDLQGANRWELGYGYLTLAYTGLLATSTLYNFIHHDYVARVWCLLGTSVFCAAFSSGLSLRPWLAMLPGFIMLVALSIALLQSPEPLVRWTVLLVCMYSLQYRQSVMTKFDVIVDQIRTKRQLRNLSEQDGLTGLANRRQFELTLTQVCGREDAFAVLYLDLDRFKAVNDTFGHAIGDNLLQGVAERLRTMVRHSDLVARLGGDEFAIIQASPTSEADAEALARRINAGLAKTFDIGGKTIEIGASVGIRLRTAGEDSPSNVLSSADKALYQVKKQGRGGFAISASDDAASHIAVTRS